MLRFFDRLITALTKGAWLVLGALPLAWSRAFLEGLGALFGRLDWRHRRVARENLLQAFPQWSARQRHDAMLQAFRNWGRIAAELMHADELYDEEAARAWEPIHLKIEELRARGHGVLILTAHTGNFELMARHCGLTGLGLTLFHRPMKVPGVDLWLRQQRASMNVSTLNRGVALRAILTRLADDGVVAAPLDQNQLRGRGIFVPMFGRLASTSTMLARLSLATGAPVVPIFARWNGDRTEPRLYDVIEPSGPGSPADGIQGRPAQMEALTAAYTRVIEEAVCEAPHDWNWAHRRWKTRPPEETVSQS